MFKKAFVINTHARKVDYQLIKRIKEQYPNSPIHIENPEDFPRMFDDIVNKEKPDVIVWVTGDGGAHLYSTNTFRLFETEDVPPVLIAPSGTFNVFSKVLGQSRIWTLDLLAPVRKLDRCYTLEETVCNLMKIERDGEQPLFCWSATSGLIYNMFEMYNEKKSFVNGARMVVQTMASFYMRNLMERHYERMLGTREFSMVVDGKQMSGEFNGIAVYSIPINLLGFKVPYSNDLQVMGGDFGSIDPLVFYKRGIMGQAIGLEVERPARQVVLENAGHTIVDGDSYNFEDPIKISLYQMRTVDLETSICLTPDLVLDVNL